MLLPKISESGFGRMATGDETMKPSCCPRLAFLLSCVLLSCSFLIPACGSAEGKTANKVFYYEDETERPKKAEGPYNQYTGKEGKWKEYRRDGTLRAEGTYAKDERHGEWKFYTPDGKIDPLSTGKYENGRPVKK